MFKAQNNVWGEYKLAEKSFDYLFKFILIVFDKN